MMEIHNAGIIAENVNTNIDDNSYTRQSPRKSSCSSPEKNGTDNLNIPSENESDDMESVLVRTKYNMKRFEDSDSETEISQNKHVSNYESRSKSCSDQSSDEESVKNISKNIFKSRIRKSALNSSDSESDSVKTVSEKAVKNEEQQNRMKQKRSKLKQKFHNLVNSRLKEKSDNDRSDMDNPLDVSNTDNSEDSNEDSSSVAAIKKIIKEKSVKLSICDPDTSDDEARKPQRKKPKSTKMTSPKPLRMSAKQAMENMQKIKSESNRMLREKEVSLPYHRPKALSLKDIMNRRKPAVALDGKALPIKMNEEQLKQYALQLEQRQKEMMELCKSDTEDEESPVNEENAIENSSEISKNINALDDNIDCKDICEKAENSPGEVIAVGIINPETNRQDQETNDQEKENMSVIENNTPGIEKYSEEDTEKTCEIINDVPNNTLDNVNNNIVLTRNDDIYLDTEEQVTKVCSEPESQLISLHYDSEKFNDMETVEKANDKTNNITELNSAKDNVCSFSDDDINMEEIDSIIENAEIIKDKNEDYMNSPMLIKYSETLNKKPKLAGAPGMVIDLDGTDPCTTKITGIELLKQRFTYFSKLKTPEELEREKERRIKPGTQHLKLKHELEEKIAEQRSLEWAKRLEEEKQHQIELKELRGEDSELEDDIDKIEAKLEGKEPMDVNEESEEDDEILEEPDKPRKKNPLIADEAEESDDCEDLNEVEENGDTEVVNDDEESEESTEESSESEEEEPSKPRKGRILKAFVDSDDEDSNKVDCQEVLATKDAKADDMKNKEQVETPIKDSQDDELQLAQTHKSFSEELFSQESELESSTCKINIIGKSKDDVGMGTQPFSILDTDNVNDVELNSQTISSSKYNDIEDSELNLQCPDNLTIVCETQPYVNDNLDAVVGMCSGSFSQNLVTQCELGQSQALGEDVLALCTGKFYDNQFISQSDDQTCENSENLPDVDNSTQNLQDAVIEKDKTETVEESVKEVQPLKVDTKPNTDGVLKSILDELNEPEFETSKPKYFASEKNKENRQDAINMQYKKKLVIESDDEANEGEVNERRMKKLKKRKLEKRVLQISDDEDEEDMEQEAEEEEYVSDIEEDIDRIVEYDSEENEVEVKPHNSKKKRKATDFFEQEAELTSEDEWVGSGDEDEAGLDRMEREEGDDDQFQQDQLQRELGQIHMRDVLDQDKREVRLLQELLFEDGDLGDGHRQRKFRWKNSEGDEGTGTVPDEFADTQEEEYESEEQWRKQRHEREVFLRQMQQNDDDRDFDISVNTTTVLKTSISSKTLMETSEEKNEIVTLEKKTSKDIPSPKKLFPSFKQNYHGSILSRGQGALARLAALATPLAGDDDATKVGSLAPTSNRNFVFATLTPESEKPKVTKRKAETSANTPKLIKKLKMDDRQSKPRNSLLDHIQI